jgi:hypothetical protein
MNFFTKVSAWHSESTGVGKSFGLRYHYSLWNSNYRSAVIISIGYTTCLGYGGRQYSRLFKS